MSDAEKQTTASPAATLIVFRKGNPAPEILMIRRSQQLAFGAGASVFPGGRVDLADRAFAASLPGDPDWNAARIAAARETLEETGLLVGVTGPVSATAAGEAQAALHGGIAFGDLLDRFGWTFAPDTLVPFARWRPPLHFSKVFDTRFLIADLGTGAVSLRADGTETTDHFWITASAMLERGKRDQEKLMFPTRMNLLRIAGFRDFTDAEADALSNDPQMITPAVLERDGARWLSIPAGLGYPDSPERLDKAHR